MTISTTIVKNSYSGDNSTSTFNYTFKVLSSADLKVIIRNTSGVEVTKTLTTHYTIANVGNASGGSITFTAGNIPTSTETVVLLRDTDQIQSIDYISNDPFPAETHEEGLDRSVIIAQELQEEVDRSLKLSRTNTMTNTEFTVGPTERANKVLAFDSAGEIAVTQELGTFRGNWSASTSYQVRDLVKDTSTNNIFIVNTAHTSSGSQPLTSNTNSAKYDLIVDAATATTSATNAASSATAAANSATAAASSATTASTQASNASTSASTASTQATNASNSATSAASSASSAAASYDNFDDRYLGAKSSNPSTDNDGDALITGALYFNTSSNQIFSWTGSAWIAIKPTSSEQTAINNAATNATNASNSASAASTSATNAASSATSASSSASSASTSASAAQTAQAAAEAAADNFDDTYLGAKSSDPSTDNDGDALNSGDLYFNTTSNQLKVYNGSSWIGIGANTDQTAKVSANDTTAGFLNGKLVAGSNVTLTENNNGGNETLTITASDNSIPFAIALGG